MKALAPTSAVALLAIGAAGTPLPAAAAAPATSVVSLPADDAEGGKLLLMLDASGSMKDKDPSGLTKMDVAKKALNTVVDGLPDGSQVGLRVYGATQPGGTPTPAACKDTQLVTPIGPADKGALKAAIGRFQAKGETPIAYSLGQALKDLGPSGKRNIVLVSDGEESCTPDPCPEIKKLVASGVDLRIDTVGFAVNDKAKKQLQCVADAGHGTYYDAKDAGQLTTSVRKLSVRAFRPFAVAGTSVQGTTSPLDAPHLKVGQYVDTIPTTNGTRYYRITRHPESDLRIAVTSRPAVNASDYNKEEWKYELTNLKGNTCRSESGDRTDFDGYNQLINGTLHVWGDDYSCGKESDLILTIKRPEGGQAGTPTEIKVMEEAQISNIDSLPGDQQEADPLRPPVSPKPTSVIGGTSFNDAQPLRPGTYVADMAPGEIAFFKVPLDWGQKATFGIDGPDSTFTQWPKESYLGLNISGQVYTPDRREAHSLHKDGQFRKDSFPDDVVTSLPAVTYRNRKASSSYVQPISLAGDYYYAVGLGTKNAGQVTGTVPVKFSVGVSGDPTGKPDYLPLQALPAGGETATPTASESVSAIPPESPSESTSASESSSASSAPTTVAAEKTSSDGGVPSMAWILGGVVAAVAAIGGGVAAAMRRREN